jgi:hypothetical protein
MKDEIFIFWHVCGLNHWKEIAEDQYKTMESSGLVEKSKKIMVTFLGKDRKEIKWLENKSKKISVSHDTDFSHYERKCLNGLRDWSGKNKGLVLYLHAKGVSRIKQKKNVWGWRKLLEYYLVENHEKCIGMMDDLDALGGNLCAVGRRQEELDRPGHRMHYSGNFWWAQSSYLRTLPKIPENIRMEKNNNYWMCEYWLLSPFPAARCGVAFKTNKPHYYESHPEKDFKEKWK